jgi:hypothetical protein
MGSAPFTWYGGEKERGEFQVKFELLLTHLRGRMDAYREIMNGVGKYWSKLAPDSGSSDGVQDQSWQKVSKTPISTNNLNMVMYPYNPSYVGGIGRRIAGPRQK